MQPVGSTEEVLYTRYGNNPNQVRLAEKLAALEGADAAIFLASGMGATALAHMAMLRPGDHLLASDWIYGGTRRLFSEEFGKLGIDVTFVAPDNQRFPDNLQCPQEPSAPPSSTRPWRRWMRSPATPR